MATARRKKRSRGPRINAPIPAHQQPTPPLARVHARRFPPTLHSRTTFRRLTFKNSTPPLLASPFPFPPSFVQYTVVQKYPRARFLALRFYSSNYLLYENFYNIFINSLNCFRRFDDSRLRNASKASLVRTFHLNQGRGKHDDSRSHVLIYERECETCLLYPH